MRAVGIDVSKHQGTFNPAHAINQVDFVIQRASWAGYKDERFAIIYQGVQQFPSRGAYHYYSTGVDWKRQADLFLSVTEGKGFGVLSLDYEHGYNNLTERTADNAFMWLEYVRNARPNSKVIFYSGAYVYRDFMLPYAGDWSKYDWWIARYPWIPQPRTAEPKQAPGTPERPWTIWQYSKTGKGSLYGCSEEFVDLDVFNGDVDIMKDYFGQAVAIPPVEDCRAETIQECIDTLEELK